MTTIDNNNYELWMVRYAEDDLTVAERETVEAWLADHPEAAGELALYNEAPRLERDEDVRYAAVLRQRTRPMWPMALRWSAAAAVLLAIALPLIMHHSDASLPSEEVAMVRHGEAKENTKQLVEIEKSVVEIPELVNIPNAHETVEHIAVQTIPEPSLDTAPASVQPKTSVVYVNDLIAYEEEEESSDVDNEPVALAMANEETINNGISMPRLIGSILKSNIKKQ